MLSFYINHHQLLFRNFSICLEAKGLKEWVVLWRASGRRQEIAKRWGTNNLLGAVVWASFHFRLTYYITTCCNVFLDLPYQKYSQTKTVSLYNSLQLAFCVMSVLNCVFFSKWAKEITDLKEIHGLLLIRLDWSKLQLFVLNCFDSDMFSCSLKSNTPGIFCRLFCFPRAKPMTIGLDLLV